MASAGAGVVVAMRSLASDIFFLFLFSRSRAQRRSARDLGVPGKHAAPSRYKDGGASRREGAKERWEREEGAWLAHSRPAKQRKRDVMLANRASSNEPQARRKAVATSKRRRKEAEHLEMSQKRLRRSRTQYQRDFGKGRARFGFFSSFDGLFVRNAGYVACARVYANSQWRREYWNA